MFPWETEGNQFFPQDAPNYSRLTGFMFLRACVSFFRYMTSTKQTCSCLCGTKLASKKVLNSQVL